MKIRATIELVDFLGGRKKTRKRELIALSQELSSKNKEPAPLIRRAAVVLSYAHWEGFVKDAAQGYVHLISHKTHSLASLSPNFQALACRQELTLAASANRRIHPHITVVNRLIDDIEGACTIDAKSAIDTESNLTSKIFSNIFLCVGIDYQSTWATYGPFIDDLFLNRCAVAHGELFTPNVNYALETVRFSMRAIDQFSAEIENAAVQKAYFR